MTLQGKRKHVRDLSVLALDVRFCSRRLVRQVSSLSLTTVLKLTLRFYVICNSRLIEGNTTTFKGGSTFVKARGEG